MLEKRISEIDGFGIYTTKNIIKDTQYYIVPLDIVYSESKPRCARIADGKYISDKILNWVNHSCNPNTILNIEAEPPVLISIRDILPNEEITVDYNLTEINGEKVICTCNSENCRGFFYRN